MRRLRSFFQVMWAERGLLTHATILVVAIRLGLWLLPFRVVRRAVARSNRKQGVVRAPMVKRIAWAVAQASRCMPHATCLTQALAVQALLQHYGYACVLRIGVAKQGNGKLAAHAWIEHAGEIVIGGPADHIARYTPLPSLPSV